MTTQTATTEWIDRVLEQHRHVRTVVAELGGFLSTSRPKAGTKGSHSWAAELSQRLLTLHDELFRHFRFEEQAGAHEEIVESHPEAAKELESVLGEHPLMLRELRRTVADVLVYSEGVRPENPRLRRRITELLEALHRHEELENHLFQRLEYQDIGASD